VCGRVEKFIQNFGYNLEWKRQLGTVRCRWKDIFKMDIKGKGHPQSSSTLWNYSKCGIYTVESEAGC
jgi:hypothetical protein